MADGSKILLAGVGYPDLRDMSFGPKLVERLRDEPLPPDVRVEDLSYNPVAVVHWLEEDPGLFERAIFFGAVERGREPGTLLSYPWLERPLDPDDVQESVSEALVGIINLENVLVVAQHFGVLPKESTVIELEPVELEWGMELSRVGKERMEEAVGRIHAEISSGAVHAGNGKREEAEK